MKITRQQLRRIIGEAFDKDFFVDREANPHDGGMYGEPEGGWDVEEELADEADYADGFTDGEAGLPTRKDASPAYLEGWAEGRGPGEL